jgi:hypothetical protein
METPNISRVYPSVTGARAHSCRPSRFDSPTSRHHAGAITRHSLIAPIGALCGDGESLVDYDPTAGTSTVLLGPTVNGGGVRDALPYPGYE